MPYEIKQSAEGYCIHKQGGEPVPGGCHKSKSKALRHMRALYANESEATKADGKGYGAKVGETISGNLARGGGGRFASAGSAQPTESADEKPRQRRQKLGSTAARREAAKLQAREDKKRATASASEAKRQARRQEVERRRAAIKKEQEARKLKLLAQNRKAVIDATQLDDASLSALEQFAKGGNLEPGDATDMLVALGLVTKSPTTGEYVMSSHAKSLLSAISSGDIRQAKDAVTAGLEARATARNQRIKKDESNKEASLSVFKDASGRFRWVLLSSNAYRDRDGEIVSTKALLDDVARADKDKDYGPLRWWHVPGLDIGDCDFNAMSGRFLVESGTFRDERIGKAVLKAQDKFQASIGFRHPSTEPDAQGVYHNIRRFERSLTPLGRASNPFTRLVVQERQMEDMEKAQQLKATIGDEAFNALLSLIQSKQKENDAIGVAHKEASPGESPAPTLTADDVARVVTADNGVTVATSSAAGALYFQQGTTTGALDSVASPDDTPVAEEPIYAGDLLPNELVSLITSNVVSALTPLVATKMKELSDEIKVTLSTTTKADEIALLQEQQSRQAAQLEATIKALAAEHDKTTQALKAAQAQLAELAGEQPRALKQEQAPGYRASQSPDTIIGEAHRLKEAQPQGIDPNFFNAMIPGLGGGDANGGPPKY